MKIRTQLISTFALIILLTLSVFGYNFYIQQQNTKLIALIQDQSQDLLHAEQIKFYLSGHSNDQRGYLLTNDESFIEESKDKMEKVTENLNAITQSDLPQKEQQTYALIENQLQKYKVTTNQFNQLTIEEKVDEAEYLHLNEIRSIRKELTPVVDTFVQNLSENNRENQTSIITKTKSSQTISFYLLIGLTIISSLIIYYLINRINKPLNKLIDASRVIAKGDFSVSLDTSRKDELGLLAKAFDEMKDSVREIISSIMNASSKVASSSQELMAAAEENTVVAKRITDTAISLAEKGTDQQEIIAVTISSVNETMTSLERMKQDSAQMSKMTDETFHSTTAGAEMVGKIVVDTKALEQQIIETVGITETLSVLSNEIERIVVLIKEFAEQTKLLSFNASIEAARAGEYGKGFAVVAQEIKSLSDNSKENAQKVSDLVQQIQKQASICTTGMQASYKQVEQNLQLIDHAHQSFELIKENAHSSKQKVENVTSNIQSIFTQAKKLISATQGLERIAHQLNGLSHENSAASEEQLASLEQISATSTQLTLIAEDLERETQRFRL